jgi:hypothetical protein
LTTFSYCSTAVDPPGLAVFLAVGVGVELENGDPSLFAVAGGQTKILDSGFITAIGASIDPSAGMTLGEGVWVEWRAAIYTFSHDFSSGSARGRTGNIIA